MRRVAPVLVAVLALGGCASGTSTPAKVRATVTTFLDVCTGDQPEAALDVLSEAGRKHFLEAGSPLRGCAAAVGLDAGASVPEPLVRAALERAKVSAVAVRGDYATVTLEMTGGRRSELELESPGGSWRLASPLSPSA